MNHPVKILHIDPEYQITYWIFGKGVKVSSNITIPQAIELIKSDQMDLILSEPQNLAIINSDLRKRKRPGDGSGGKSMDFDSNGTTGPFHPDFFQIKNHDTPN